MTVACCKKRPCFEEVIFNCHKQGLHFNQNAPLTVLHSVLYLQACRGLNGTLYLLNLLNHARAQIILSSEKGFLANFKTVLGILHLLIYTDFYKEDTFCFENLTLQRSNYLNRVKKVY